MGTPPILTIWVSSQFFAAISFSDFIIQRSLGEAPNDTETQIGYTFLPAFVFRPRIDGTSTGGGNFKFEQDWFVGRTGIEQNWSPGRPGILPPDGINSIILKESQTQNLSIPLLRLTSYPAANVGGRHFTWKILLLLIFRIQ